MPFNRIMVWKFNAAPAWLQRLYDASQNPEWIVFVPRTIHDADIHKAIFAAANVTTVGRYETDEGDVVYIGNAPLQQIPAMVAATDGRKRELENSD